MKKSLSEPVSSNSGECLALIKYNDTKFLSRNNTNLSSIRVHHSLYNRFDYSYYRTWLCSLLLRTNAIFLVDTKQLSSCVNYPSQPANNRCDRHSIVANNAAYPHGYNY